MKCLFAFLLMTFLINHTTAQDTLKRYQYDEFIYGVTAPKVKNIEDLAAYYDISVGTIDTFNQRMFQTDLSFDHQKVIYLPAGTLFHNRNVAYEKLDSIFENIRKINVEGKPIHYYRYICHGNDFFFPNLKDDFIYKILNINDSPTIIDNNCYEGCLSAIARIRLENGYNGFIINHHERPGYSYDWLYIFHHTDFIQRIQIGGGEIDEGFENNFATTFDDFLESSYWFMEAYEINNSNPTDILVEKSFRNASTRDEVKYEYSLYVFQDGKYVQKYFLGSSKIRNRIMRTDTNLD